MIELSDIIEVHPTVLPVKEDRSRDLLLNSAYERTLAK